MRNRITVQPINDISVGPYILRDKRSAPIEERSIFHKAMHQTIPQFPTDLLCGVGSRTPEIYAQIKLETIGVDPRVSLQEYADSLDKRLTPDQFYRNGVLNLCLLEDRVPVGGLQLLNVRVLTGNELSVMVFPFKLDTSINSSEYRTLTGNLYRILMSNPLVAGRETFQITEFRTRIDNNPFTDTDRFKAEYDTAIINEVTQEAEPTADGLKRRMATTTGGRIKR